MSSMPVTETHSSLFPSPSILVNITKSLSRHPLLTGCIFLKFPNSNLPRQISCLEEARKPPLRDGNIFFGWQVRPDQLFRIRIP